MPSTPPKLVSINAHPGYEPAKSLDTLTQTSPDWLWWPWIPLNKLSIIEGEPDVGKSTITLDIAARVSNGRSFPQTTIDGEYNSNTVDKCKLLNKPSGVLIIGIEDDLEDTVVPRLAGAGANLSNIYTTGVQRDKNGVPEPLTIPDGTNLIEEDIKTSKAKLVIIDPITAFFSDKVKAGDDSSHRRALNYLVDIAKRHQCAILLVRHHNKAVGQSAKNRGSGSVAIGAIARSVFTAGKYTDEEGNTKYALADVKCNIAPDKDSISYQLEAHPANSDVPVVRWGKTISVKADELVQSEGSAKRSNSKEQQCKDLIQDLLEPGPQLAEYMLNFVSEQINTSTKTVGRAADKLGVSKEQSRGAHGQIGAWMWSLSSGERQADVG